MKTVFVLLACLSVCGAQWPARSANPVKAQRSFLGEVRTTTAESVGETLKFAEGNFLSIAEAMPENKYDYIPTSCSFDDARSFGSCD